MPTDAQPAILDSLLARAYRDSRFYALITVVEGKTHVIPGGSKNPWEQVTELSMFWLRRFAFIKGIGQTDATAVSTAVGKQKRRRIRPVFNLFKNRTVRHGLVQHSAPSAPQGVSQEGVKEVQSSENFDDLASGEDRLLAWAKKDRAWEKHIDTEDPLYLSYLSDVRQWKRATSTRGVYAPEEASEYVSPSASFAEELGDREQHAKKKKVGFADEVGGTGFVKLGNADTLSGLEGSVARFTHDIELLSNQPDDASDIQDILGTCDEFFNIDATSLKIKFHSPGSSKICVLAVNPGLFVKRDDEVLRDMSLPIDTDIVLLKKVQDDKISLMPCKFNDEDYFDPLLPEPRYIEKNAGGDDFAKLTDIIPEYRLAHIERQDLPPRVQKSLGLLESGLSVPASADFALAYKDGGVAVKDGKGGRSLREALEKRLCFPENSVNSCSVAEDDDSYLVYGYANNDKYDHIVYKKSNSSEEQTMLELVRNALPRYNDDGISIDDDVSSNRDARVSNSPNISQGSLRSESAFDHGR